MSERDTERQRGRETETETKTERQRETEIYRRTEKKTDRCRQLGQSEAQGMESNILASL